MYNKSQKSLGIPTKVYKVIHRIALIAILHSTLIAPSQNLMHEYYKIKTAKINKGYVGSNLLTFSDYNDLFDKTYAVENNQPNVVPQKRIVLKEKPSGFSNRYFYSDVKIGSIGKSSKVNFDDPSDNVFNFNFNKKQVANTTVFLKYSVYGIDPKSMPSKSINSTYVTGGYAYKESNQWNEVIEEIDSEWLVNGRNSIFFSIPENSGYTYKVKDVTLFTAPTKLDKNEIVLNNEGVFIKKDNKIYINGFFKKSKIAGSDIKILANNQELKVFDNKFENFIDFKDEKIIDLKVFQNGILIAKDLIAINKVVEADKVYTIENKFVRKSKFVTALSASNLEVDGAKLSVLDGSLVESKEISISMLRAIDIAPLESGFINVTKDKKAFRFLPDGTKFAKPVKIEIEYDEKLIPMGYTPKDIKTFYFDIQHKKWLEVTKDSVDQINKKVLSSTTHFTDYINGIIQTPESPQTSAFTPTMMNDIKASSPESQITLISPPEVSQKGTANISYPIKIPAGRNGMQPQVAIQYSSDGGNGWLGEGWGVSTPAITLDTRWGIPAFDPINESEIYNLNGEQLMYPKIMLSKGVGIEWMPNRHIETSGVYQTIPQARGTNEKQFTFRKQGDFSKIERKGTNPSDYYWKVTSTDGTISWYGGKDAVVNNAVIKNDQGNIVQWSLYMVEDVYTNNIKYNYTSQIIPNQYGINANLNQGLVYNLNNIEYTGFGNESGKYKVEFHNDATIIRPDISINSRLGLKQITPFRLDQIKVSFDGSLIRSYKLEYLLGKFEKSLLTKIIEKDAAGNNFYEHKLEYYDDIADNVLFVKPAGTTQLPNAEADYALNFGDLVNASKINSSQKTEFSWDVRPAVGFELFYKTNKPQRNLTVGFPFGESYTKSRGKISFVDVNGDGLDDVLFKKDDKLFYYPRVSQNPNGFVSSNPFAVNPIQINAINEFSKTNGKTKTMFLESFDLMIGKFYLGRKRFKSEETTSIYLSDGNGDRIPDIVRDGVVYFNDGNANFGTSSQTTPNMLITADAYVKETLPDPEPEPNDFDYTKYDLVRVWEAPYDGEITITDDLEFFPTTATSKIVYSIETKLSETNAIPFRIYLKELNTTTTTESVSITSYSGNNPPLGNATSTLNVKKGQKIFFRAHKNKGVVNDVLKTSPIIQYVNGNDFFDSNNFQTDVYKHETGFKLDSDLGEVLVEESGNVQITWENLPLNNLSDDVKFRIVLKEHNEAGNVTSETVVYEYDYLANTNDVLYNANLNQAITISKGKGDVGFYFEVISDSNINWNHEDWYPNFVFTSSLPSPNKTFTKYAIPSHTIFQEAVDLNIRNLGNAINETYTFKCNSVNYTTVSNTYYALPISDVATTNNAYAFNSSDKGYFTFVVKKAGVLLGKRKIAVHSGQFVFEDATPIQFSINSPEELKSMNFEFYVDGIQNLKLFYKYTNNVSYNASCSSSGNVFNFVQNAANVLIGTDAEFANAGQNTNLNNFRRILIHPNTNLNKRLGGMHRNWGQFLYNSGFNSNQAIPSDINGKLIDVADLEVNLNTLSALYANCESLAEAGGEPYENCVNNSINTQLGIPAEGSITPDNISTIGDGVLNNPLFSNLGISGAFVQMFAKIQVNDLKRRWAGPFVDQYSEKESVKTGEMETGFFPSNYFGSEEEESTPLQQNLQTGMNGVDKEHRSVALSYSGGYGSFSASRSNSRYSNLLSDFVDLNGDSYPDILTTNSFYKTTMTGGHKLTQQFGLGVISASSSNNTAVSVSRGFPIAGRGGVKEGKQDNGNPSFSLGIGVGLNLNGTNLENQSFIDINGDGLTDLFNDAGGYNVKLNYGKYFNSLSENFNYVNPVETKPSALDSPSFSLSLGSAEGANIPFSVSLGYSSNNGNTKRTYVDINGDSLPDLLTFDGTSAKVRFNLGNRFSSTEMDVKYDADSAYILSLLKNNKTSSLSLSGNVSFFAGSCIFYLIIPIGFFVIVIPFLFFKAGATFGGSANLSVSETNKDFNDFSADGFPDFIEKDGDNIKVYNSRIRRTNKLKTVFNPLGGSFSMDYTPQNITFNNPNSNWVMTSLVVDDGRIIANDGANLYKKTFSYVNGKYDRRERAFYGYETVTVGEGNVGFPGYKVTETKYHNQNYFLEGLAKESTFYNEFGQIYSKTINTYQIKKTIANGTINLSSNEPFTYDVGGTEGRRQAAVLLTKTTSELYEFGTTPIVSEISFEYDGYGRVKKYIDKGNVAISQDDYSSEISYHVLSNNILTVPQKIVVYQNGTLMRQRENSAVNSNTGDVLEIKTKLNATENAVTKMTYDQYGNILTILYPQNVNGQSMKYTYTYDAALNKYVESITDSFNYVSTATYDSKFDALLTTKDLAGNVMKYEYDNLGRVVKIIAPKEATNVNPYTIKFEYFNKHSQLTPYGYHNCVTVENFIPFAVTKHYDVEHPENPIETVTFVDGLARPIQVKKDVEINTTVDASLAPTYVEYMSVSGIAQYDDLGRVVKQYHPKKEVKNCTNNYLLNQVPDSADAYYTKVEYDALDRAVKTTDPAGNISVTQYSLANDYSGTLSIKTKSIVDQNATAQVITESYSDVRGKTTSTVNIGGPNGDILTKFDYNAIGELQAYQDAEGLATKYRYDNAGRKIEVVHPDSGMSTYKYDTASNLINSQNANLIANGESIVYKYDYNRLLHVVFPTLSGSQNISDVNYKYGAVGQGNKTGRLIFQQDATGTQEFDYGNMGEMVYNKRTIVAPNLPTRVFESKFDYDSWNRIQKMTYPDGEVLNYAYDKGGNLSKMTGEYNSQPYDYISRIDYDYFEQRTYIKYGNNTETKYTYTNDLRRLTNLQAKASSGQLLFNNSYAYDKVGNILGINNTAPYNTATALGGTYNHSYSYDKLNRLSSASGSFYGRNKKATINTSNYTLNMEYNNTHGITLKNQLHNVNYYENSENTYSNKYKYIADSHRIESIEDGITNQIESFKYDANGNTTTHIKMDGTHRQMLWDESNRLRVVSDNEELQHYIYDAAGERILKASSTVEQVYQNGQLVNGGTAILNNYTTYASAYLVIDAAQQYSKHYYAGSQRIVSKMGEQNGEIFNERKQLKEFGPQPDTKSSLNAIKQLQISDLQNRLQKAKLGKAIFKDYKPEDSSTKEDDVDDELDEEKENLSEGNSTNRAAMLTGLYFFHPDHLGTSTFLTDANGNPYQFFLNLPFGETMYEQHSYTESYANPYKFNGKELDTETGLYYYGARYYNPRLSTWYSVDPLAEKFPNFNPYNYCMQNPVRLIDPTGMSPEEGGDPKITTNMSYSMTYKGKGNYTLNQVKETNVMTQNEDGTMTTNTTTVTSKINYRMQKDNNGKVFLNVRGGSVQTTATTSKTEVASCGATGGGATGGAVMTYTSTTFDHKKQLSIAEINANISGDSGLSAVKLGIEGYHQQHGINHNIFMDPKNDGPTPGEGIILSTAYEGAKVLARGKGLGPVSVVGGLAAAYTQYLVDEYYAGDMERSIGRTAIIH